jgi:uncharacterized protein YbaP (TraB family)
MPVHFPRLIAVAIVILTIGQMPLGVAAALPIFDAHFHYNDEAAAVYPVSQVVQRFRDNGVRTILATSTPNDGTRALGAATRAHPGDPPRVVPFLRPYRNAADRGTWFNDPAIYTMIETELARDADWRGIGEFHLNGLEADTALVKKMVALAVARGLFLHAHCDEAALTLLLRDDPRARIIWAHTGFSVTPEKIADYFARYPNLVGELSYRDDVVADGKLTPAWRALFLAYPDRFVIGSDTWTNERWVRYDEIIARYRGWLDQLPAPVASMIAHGNGERLFPAVASAPSSAPRDRGLLFRIDKAGLPPSYVFGTLHSGDPRVTALPAEVARAFDAAKSFATESRLSDREIGGFMEAAQFDDGHRLADFFDAATIDQIRAALGSDVPSDAIFERLKPWALMLKLAERPASATYGVTLDQQLLDDARRRKLAIVGLELPDEQVAAFDSITLPAQVALVKFVLAHRDALTVEHEQVVAAWLDRDLGRLAELNAAQRRKYPEVAPHLAELTRHLIDDRSVQMAHRLFLPLRSGRVFVAVGALHLHGERSLLALLREQGYRIHRVF